MSLTPERKKHVGLKDTRQDTKLSKKKTLVSTVARKIAMGIPLNDRERTMLQVMATLNEEGE